MPDPTIGTLIDQAMSAYARLGAVGEAVEDEWTYIDDLTRAWRTRLEAVATARGGEPANEAIAAAVAIAADEIERISDPHRAIDWLSTFPQVVLTAMGERP